VDNKNQNTNTQTDGVDSGSLIQAGYVAPAPPELADTEALSMDPTALANEPAISVAPEKTGVMTKILRRVDLLLLALLVIGAIGLIVMTTLRRNDNPAANNAAREFGTVQLPLDQFAVASESGLNLTAGSVVINGPLKLNEGVTITPSVQPNAPTAGQLYYDQNTNQLAYFNGTSFVPLTANGQVVQSIGGLTGQITLGGGLSVVGNQLVSAVGATGVTSFGGATGAITLGPGLNLTGNTLQNVGALSITAGPNISVTNDGNGNYTITNTGSGTGTVTSGGGAAGTIPLFTAAQNIENSILTQAAGTVTVTGNLNVTGTVTLSAPLGVANGGTGNATLTTNGVLVGNGAGPVSAVTTGVAGQCLMSTAGAPAFGACPGGGGGGVTSLNGLSGVLTVANASGVGSTITIDDATTGSKGIASFNNTNFSVSGGAVNTIQNIATNAAPTFGQLTLTSSQATNPMLLVNNTNGAASGNLLDLQVSGVSRFSVQPSGATSISDNLNVTGSTILGGDIAVNGGDITSTGALNITPGGTLTIGTGSQTLALQGGASSSFAVANGGNTTTVNFQAPTANVTYRFATTAAGSYDVCTTAGNCVGSGGGVSTGGGTTNRLAKFSASQVIGDSSISDDGSLVSTTANLTVQGGTLTSGVANSQTGSLVLAFAGGNFTGSITPGTLTASRTYTLPDASGTFCLNGSSACGFASGSGTAFVQGGNTFGAAGDLGTNDGQALNLRTNGATRVSISSAGVATFSGNVVVNGTSVTSSGALDITPGGTLTVGATTQQLTLQGDSATSLRAVNGGNSTTVNFQAPAAAVTYRFATATAGTYDICSTAGNCAGSGGGVTTPGGATNQLAKFTGSQTIGDSSITDNGTTVTTTADFVIQGGNATVGVAGSVAGILELASTAAFTGSLQTATLTANRTITLPDADGTVCLSSGNCLGGGGGGANTSLSNLTAVAINTTLLPGAAGTINLGSGALPFGDLFLAGTSGTPASNNFRLTGAATGALTITLPDASGTVCLQSAAACGFALSSGSSNYIQNQIASQQPSSNFWISGTGRADTSILTALVDTPAAGTLALGTTNATGISLDQNTTLAANRNFSMATGTGTFSQSYTGTGNAFAVTANSLQSGAAMSVTSSNNTAANTAWSSMLLNFTNAQSGTAVSTGSIAGLDVQFTQAASVNSNVETVANFVVKRNDSSTADQTVTSILNLANNDTATGNQINVTDALKINGGTNIANGINLSGTFNTNLITATNLTIAQNGNITSAGDLAVNGGDITSTGALNITPGGTLTVGATGQALTLQGNASTTLSATGGGFTTTIGFTGAPTGAVTYEFDRAAAAGTYTVCTTAGNCLGGGAGGANTALSNLTGVAINTHLLPGSAGAVNLGSGTLPFGDLYLAGSSVTPGTNNFRITGASTTGTRTITLPDATGTVCLQSSTACGFAPASGSANYIQNSTASQTANFNVRSANANDVAGIVRGAASQTADIFQVQAAGGGVLFAVDGDTNYATFNDNVNINGTGGGGVVALTVRGATGGGAGDLIADFQAGATGNTVARFTNDAGLYLGNAGASIAGSVNISNTSGFYGAINSTGLTAARTLSLPNTTGTLCAVGFNCAVTLQDAYTFSAGGSTPEIKLASGKAGLDIQDSDTTLGAGANFISLRAPNAGGLGTILFGVGMQGNLYMVPSTDRTDYIDINNNAGNNLLTVDSATSNGRVGIGLGGSSLPAYTLDVGGDANLVTGSAYRINGTSICTISGCTPISGSANYIQNQNASQQTSSNYWISGTGRADTSLTTPLLDTATAVALALGTTNATAINLNQNTTVAASRTLTVTSALTTLTGATSGDALRVSNSTSTGNIAVFRDNTTNVVTIGDGGAVLLQNETNQLNALEVLTTVASGSNVVLNADTINQRVGVGGVASFSKFEVIGGDAAVYNNGNNPRLIIGDSTTAGQNGFMQWDSANDYFRIETAGTNGLKINDNFLAIGNIFPDQPLKVGNGSTLLFQVNTSGAATLVGGQAVDLTAISTSAANGTGSSLTVAGGNQTSATCGTGCTGGALALQGGAATGGAGVRIGGAVTIEGGAGAGGGANGAINIGATNSSVITLGTTGGTNSITLGRSTASNTINIGNGTTAAGNTQTVNIATSATSTGKAVVTIGNTNDGSSLLLQGGTGHVTLSTNSASANIIAKSSTNGTGAFKVVNSGNAAFLSVNTSATDPGTYFSGTGTNGGGSRIFFGEVGDPDVYIGEDGTGDSDTMVLASRVAFSFLSGSSSDEVLNVNQNGFTKVTAINDSFGGFQVNRNNGHQILGVFPGSQPAVYIGNYFDDNTAALLYLDRQSFGWNDPAAAQSGAMYYSVDLESFRCFDVYWRNCLASARTEFRYYNDYVGIAGDAVSQTVGSGTGAGGSSTAGGAGHPGQVTLTTGTTTTGAALVGANDNGTPFLFGNGDYWRFESVVKVPTLSTGGESFTVKVGMTDNGANAPTDGCWFSYTHSESSGNWQGNCATGGTTSTCDTGIAVTAGSWARLTFDSNTNGTENDFIVNGSWRCQVTANIPDTGGNEFSWNVAIRKTGAGTTARTLIVDYVEVVGQLGTPR
jgi:hypothetical protein